ncbi:hypothetical protein IVB45_26610 [Bradyrhizobium sp. 4]|nr:MULTISPECIES: hypothetical protein [unclassified Bradyrhizobium]MCK1399947.1 hypothetical protein [Bradyrhizobium sp. 39]MCK1747674.1 hypothetical protein [Bradyrhizobium sp. 135]UPJ38899.1 hypothetical protein IVB45_26610 [Bradyrhizobium sp. 4]
MLRRIPAVKWAFNRLRPAPHGGSIDVAADAADASPALVAEILEAAPALDTSISADTSNCDVAAAASAAEDGTARPVIAESPSEAPADVSGSDDSSRETAAEVELVVVEEASVATIDVEREKVDAPELTINSDPSPELADDVEPVVVEKASSVDVELVPVDAPALAINDEHSSAVDVDTCSTLDDTRVSLASSAAEVVASTPSVVTDVASEPALEAPAAEITSTPKIRAKIAEPADRAALIRQRWTETGSRMWNPRVHGAGDATLNIQGSVGLLPPAPGETMPRYDKLEFRMLGGQIVCEGVIVEAPAHASQRSFTRLAEPGKPDRVREPMRERQAALA